MGELASLLTAIAGLVTALGGAVALVATAFRTSRRERVDAADSAVADLLAAAEDGKITADEITDILRRRNHGRRDT